MMNPLKTYRRLTSLGLLGINARNLDYIAAYNPRRFYPMLDDKLETKRLALAAGINVPELFGVIRYQGEVKPAVRKLQRRGDFVVKPAHGSGGEGILVFTGGVNDFLRKASGDLLSEDEVSYHVSNIISGMFSLGGRPDVALVEYRIRFDEVFASICYQGVPDVRIIVFQGVPVMAMVRLPTRQSDGKANLHQGAVGAGIGIDSGATNHAVWHNALVDIHPDTGNRLTGVKIPGWDELLLLATRCSDLVGLGYIGVDIALDQELGPMILELNARPGLNIQIANRCGLKKRLEQVDAYRREVPKPDAQARTDFAKSHFLG